MHDGLAQHRWLRFGAFVGPVIVSAAVSWWHIGTPSYWIDEAASLSAARRSVPQLLDLLKHTDAVHGTYYFILHFWILAFGDHEMATRSLSALAMISAVPGVFLICSRIAGPRGGFCGALVFAMSPTSAIFAAEARSQALVVAITVWSTVVLFRALEGRRIDRWLGYALAVAVLGYMNLFAVLVVAAHGVLVATMPVGARARSRRPDLVRWLCACAGAGLLLIPLVLVAYRQQGQIGYLSRTTLATSPDAVGFLAGGQYLAPLVLVLAVAGACSIPRGYRSFVVMWALGPAAILIVTSLHHPVYRDLYILGSVPAVSISAGCGLAWLSRGRGRVGVLLAAVALVGVSSLSVYRLTQVRIATFQADDLRSAAACLSTHERTGDAIVHLDGISRWAAAAYPSAYAGLSDLKLATGGAPVATGTLRGLDATNDVIEQRMASHDRIWIMNDIIQFRARHELFGPILRALQLGGWRKAMTCQFQSGREVLYVRRDSGSKRRP